MLMRFGQGMYMHPSQIVSIVAFDVEMYKEQKMSDARVVLTPLIGSPLTWTFPNLDAAVAHADKLAAAVISKQESTT